MKIKKNIGKALYVLMLLSIWGCNDRSDSEIHQYKRDKITHAKADLQEIQIEDALIGSIARLYIIDDYVLIVDHKSADKLIHIFNKDNFNYVTSIADIGQGPGEITVIGHIEEDKKDRAFLVSDHGKQKIFSYNLDSALTVPSYMPKERVRMDKSQFPHVYKFINDSLSVGLFIKPIGTNDFAQSVAKWNMQTGGIETLSQEHPKIKRKRISFAVSENNGLFVECYAYDDLMTIYGLDGNIKFNIYGPNWGSGTSSKTPYYRKVAFCGEHILATYFDDDDSEERDIPTKFLVFDLDGNYIKTIETDHQIADFCFDESNNRIVMNLDSEIQFAYLNLDGLI
ncbi:BF3164 family lipoprotein [Sphingobacterium pedocola]|uniref:6-bladed beta-propeller n=1 Tax=Sphingobacterium pedocola TaxID=2082722 RepID=A0ABR9TBD3_9SPHI|nr:BF3164 family lipoprotein [Sphingobacterium pedocola]MBE8722337.1 6-bladed beta-propeller [Sphingobacterium pedocola]